MNRPRISLVVPSLNQVAYIEDTIKSIICQEYHNLELILIDGGSNNATHNGKSILDIINKYSNYFSYWCMEPDLGHWDALNKGFSKSTGEIMMWLNSDDILSEGALHKIGDIYSQFEDVNWLTGRTTFLNTYNFVVMPPTVAHTKYTYVCGEIGGIQSEGMS